MMPRYIYNAFAVVAFVLSIPSFAAYSNAHHNVAPGADAAIRHTSTNADHIDKPAFQFVEFKHFGRLQRVQLATAYFVDLNRAHQTEVGCFVELEKELDAINNLQDVANGDQSLIAPSGRTASGAVFVAKKLDAEYAKNKVDRKIEFSDLLKTLKENEKSRNRKNI